MKGYSPGHETVSSARVGLAYAKSVEGAITGQVIIIDNIPHHACALETRPHAS